MYEVGKSFIDFSLLVFVEILIGDCSVSDVSVDGCWNKDMTVPWKESFRPSASFFNSLLGVWISDETLLLVFDIFYFTHVRNTITTFLIAAVLVIV